MKRKIIVGVLCGVIAVLLCITGILIGKLCKKSAVTSVISKVERGYNDRNLDSIVESFPEAFSDQIRSSFLNQASGGTEKDLWKLLEDSYGKDYKACLMLCSYLERGYDKDMVVAYSNSVCELESFLALKLNGVFDKDTFDSVSANTDNLKALQ